MFTNSSHTIFLGERSSLELEEWMKLDHVIFRTFWNEFIPTRFTTWPFSYFSRRRCFAPTWILIDNWPTLPWSWTVYRTDFSPVCSFERWRKTIFKQLSSVTVMFVTVQLRSVRRLGVEVIIKKFLRRMYPPKCLVHHFKICLSFFIRELINFISKILVTAPAVEKIL